MSINITYANETTSEMFVNDTSLSQDDCLCVCDRLIKCDNNTSGYFDFATSISDLSEVCENVVFLAIVLILRLSSQRRICKRKDLSVKHLQQRIPKKYWNHNLRSLLVLINCFFWCLYVGEVLIRWTYSERTNLGLLVLLAPITSLISTVFSLVLYGHLEHLAAHQLYLICPSLLWGVQILNNGARFYQVVCVYCVNITRAAPSLYTINSVIAFCLLIIDTTTIILWVAVDRRKQSVDLNPRRREPRSRKAKRRDPKSDQKQGVTPTASCFKKPQQRSPATPLEKKVVLIPSGEDEDEEVKFRGRRRRRISKDDVPSRLTYAHNESSFLSKCTFAWYVKLLRKGWKRPLEFSDFDKIPDEESSKHHHEKFQEAYNRMAKTSSSGEECLWKAFLLCYWPSFLFSGVLKLLGDTVNVVGPLAISPIVAFVRNIQEGTWELHGEIKNEMYFVGWLELLKNGWVLSVVAVVCSLLQSTFSQASTHLLAMAGIHVKTALQVMVYDKSLKMSVSASKRCLEKDGKLPPGGSQSLDAARVINLTWEDTCNIMTFFMHCHYVWAIPFKMCGLVALLWMQIGVSAVYAALIAVFLLVPLQFLLAKCIAAANTRVVEATDNRLALTHEVLALIRTVKTMALEVLFVRRVTDARKEELRHLLTDALLRAFMTFINQASGIVIILLAFGFYSFMEVEPLDEGVIFSSLALFNQLTVPLFILPLIVAYSIKAKRSVSRFREFFAEAEVSPRKFVASEEGTAEASENGDQEQKQILTVENGAFSYDRERKEVVLTNITTSIPRGKLTVILGGVGSGKTSFLLSLLGELPMTSGILNWKRSGSVAFVSQTPWLVNCTLKENILMGKTLQNRKYKRIIDVCALQPDIDLLPDGDDTEIGEKGINLSGGQRQRVALARALYSDLPVVLMDCPFSALDATVAQQVSRQVREEHLRKGLSSTLVIATQHNTLAVFADKVIYLEDKTIKCQGSPEEISQCHPDLWSDWTGSSSHLFPSIGEVLAGKNREKCSLWKERNYLYRHLTRISRITRKGKGQNNLADEDFNLPLLRSPLGHHFSLVRTSPLQILLPSNEMDYLPSVVFAKKKSRPPKSSVFRTISSSPTFGRSTGHNINFPLDRRFAKSLPPRPCRSRTCSRNTDDGNYKLTREDSVLKTFFASSKNKGVQTKPSKVRWNSRILSLLSRKDGSESESVEEEEDGGGVESDDTGVYDALIDDEERERGRISRWNYVAYLKACGWPAGTLFLLFLLLNQGLLISLDVWLGHWSKMCDEGNCSPANCSEGSPLEANTSFVLWNSNQTLLPGNGSDCEEVNLEISSYLLTFGLLSGFAVLSGLLTICLAQLAAHRGRRTLHENMLSAVVGTKGKFFDLNPIGRIINRFSSDVSLIDKDLGWALMHFLYFALLCSSAMLVNALISPIFIVVSVPICLVYYILQHVFRCSSRELKRLESLSRSPVMGLIAETADFPCVVRAYGIQARFFSCYFRRLDSHLESYVLFHTGNRWLGICLDYMGGVVVFMSTVACLFGSTAIEWYLLSPLTVGLAIKYTLAIPVYLNWLVRFFSDTEMCLNAVERVQQYGRLSPEVDIEQDITNTTNQVVCCSKKKCKCRDTMRSFRTSFMRTLQLDNDSACNSVNASSDHLVFENVKIFYDKNSDAVLSGVSFKVPAGQKVGVCGRTGSGKSSLLMGIVRMAEHQEGRILIDGVDVRSVRLSPLRKGISVVPQELNIFRDSVRFNMDPEKKYTDESLWNALELVKLKDFVADLPQKLETQLLGSSTLSAGQRQLLVLSRVLLEKRPLVLLDEFTSNLDSQMERYLLTMLQQQLPHSTIIFIAHSIMSLMSCDRVLSIDEGKLVEDGSPSELSQRSHGVFVSLLQSAGREGAPEGYPTHWLSQSSSVGIEVQEIEDQNSS